jgi:hypothetical protein
MLKQPISTLAFVVILLGPFANQSFGVTDPGTRIIVDQGSDDAPPSSQSGFISDSDEPDDSLLCQPALDSSSHDFAGECSNPHKVLTCDASPVAFATLASQHILMRV